MEIPTRDQIFPSTHWSILQDASDDESPTRATSLDALAMTYWRPVYAYFKRRWRISDEDAKDWTQEFFLALIRRNSLESVEPGPKPFRAYLRAALDNFVRNRHRDRQRKKRGGGTFTLTWDAVPGSEPEAAGTPDQVFQREWALTILNHAARALEQDYRERGKEVAFRLFQLRDVERPPGVDLSYTALAERFGIGVGEVTLALYRTRRDFRDRVMQSIRATVATPEEARAEVRELFGRRRF